MSALRRDADLLSEACDDLNAVVSKLHTRIGYRVGQGSEASAAHMERVADLIARAQQAADELCHQFILDAGFAQVPPGAQVVSPRELQMRGGGDVRR
jgi:peptidyl-tRNA hydrolase